MNLCVSLISDRGKILLLFSCWLLHFSFLAQNDSLAEYIRLGNIKIEGNKRTQSRIILRELLKQSGDTIHLSGLDYFASRSQQNIFNTQLFIYDSVKYVLNRETKTAEVNIKLKERWYIIPALILEIQDRNFNSWWLTKDPFRINYGVAIDWNNFTGVKDHLVFIFRRGYSEKYGVSYRIPYINKAQTVGLNFAYSYSRNNEVAYTTQENNLLFHRDYKKYMRFEHEVKGGFTVRNNLYSQSSAEILFNQTTIDDTIKILNPEFFNPGNTKIQYVSLQYRFSYDKRDSKPYPLKGLAFDIAAIKDGMNFNEGGVNNLHVTAAVKHHAPLVWRLYFSTQLKGRYMNPDRLPYYFNKALGYNDFIRGYEYYVIDGQSYILSKNSIKLQLVKTKTFELKFLKRFPQFSTLPFAAYFNFNYDAGYVQDKFFRETNYLANSFQHGYGAGLDLVTYYDVVVRFEYTFNKMGQGGLFIHMAAPF